VLVDGRYVGSTDLSNISVSAGERRIRVEKNGYEAYTKRVNFEKGRSMSMFVHLDKRTLPKGRLYVNTRPENARVRILNIGPKFFQGMDLEAGRYHVEVSSTGFKTKTLWVNLSAGEDKNIDIRLSPVSTPKSVGKITNSLGMQFVYIQPGTFMMGSPPSEPGRDSDERQHRVTLTKGFYMQTTEVTQGQWRAVMGNNPSNFKNCGNDCPVEQISWNDSQTFIQKLNRKEGTYRYRLPTEAQWEYAARAGSKKGFCFGDDARKLGQYAWSWYNSKTSPNPVAQKKPNDWGLYDIHGNVYEWCQDWKGSYPTGPVTDPTGPSSGSSRVLRGGSWVSKVVNARNFRLANRNGGKPGLRGDWVGFRLAFSPGQ